MNFDDIYNKFIEKLKENVKNGEDKEISEIIDEIIKEQLKEYLKGEIKEALLNIKDKSEKVILKNIREKLGKSITENAYKAYQLRSLRLSSRLYNNLKDVEKEALKALNEAFEAKKTIADIRKKLLEGYRFEEEDILKVKKKLPKYLQEPLAELQVKQLKTRPLKAAYIRLLESKNAKEFEKALKVALTEKSRYFAERIAKTEEARSFAFARAYEIFEDKNISLAKYHLCSCHKITDQCDFFASVDFGYGKGIYPKDEMVTLPNHPHCACYYSKIHRTIKKKENIRNPFKKTALEFKKKKTVFSVWELNQIASGKHPIDVLNERIYEQLYKQNIFSAFIKQLAKDSDKKFEKVKEDYEHFLSLGARPLSKVEKIEPPDDEFDEFGNEYNEPTEEEIEAIEEYTDWGFLDIREYNEGKNNDKRVGRLVETLKGIFASYAPNSKGKILYRGASRPREKYNRWAKAKIGEVFVFDWSFSSWSEKNDIANDFAEPNVFETPIMFRMIDSGRGGYKIAKYSVDNHQDEDEVLLPRYPVVEVIDKHFDEKGILWIDLTRRDDLEGRLKGWTK